MRLMIPCCAALLTIAACDGDAWLIVEASGPWDGTVTSGSQVTHAQGDASGWEFPLLGESACWQLQNRGGTDGLRAYVRRNALVSIDRVGYAETQDPHGTVRGCT